MESFSKITSIYFSFLFNIKGSKYFIPIIEFFGAVDSLIFEKPDAGYCSLNDWFRRRIKKDFLAESIPKNDEIFFSPCEGIVKVYKAFPLNGAIKIKSLFHSLEELTLVPLKKEVVYDVYDFQLRPRDCHVIYSNVEGKIIYQNKIEGKYLPVNFLGRSLIDNLFCKNRRDVAVIETESLGQIYFIEVGSLNVGSINQMVQSGQIIRKGEEKSYFQFGGSAILIVIEHGKVKTNLDERGEYVFIGSAIGSIQ